MKTFPFLLIAAVLGAGGCQSLQNNPHPASPADITVKFQDPDKFFDVKDSFNAGPSQYYLDTLSQHLKQVAARRLSAGEKLTVTFTNIDLAGEIPPGSIESIRIIKEIDIPRMDLSFRLTDAAGKLISEGTRQLQNADYTSELLLPSERGQPLVFDKLLLTRWVNHEFKPAS